MRGAAHRGCPFGSLSKGDGGEGLSCICERPDCFCGRIFRDGAFCQGLSRPYSRRAAARAMMSLCEGAFAVGATCLLIKIYSF